MNNILQTTNAFKGLKKFKFLLILFVLSFQLNQAQAQWVTIPDSTFAAKLNVLFPSCMNGNQMDTTCSGIINATTISLAGQGISDFTGIEYFSNLETFICSNNQITVLPTLPGSLKSLNCMNNQISVLQNLPANLTSLNCKNNNLSSLPPLPITLIELNCEQNYLSSLPVLPSTLESLTCNNNQLTNLTNLPNNLKSLYCSENSLSSLPTLPNSLQNLEVNFNQLTTLPTLPANLLTLYCQNNQLSSLTSLPSSIVIINCNSNSITNLPILPNSLTTLSCALNQLSVLPTLPNSLTTLACGQNLLTSLPTLPASLEYLACSANQISVLPNIPANLATLYCNSNQLTYVPEVPNVMAAFHIQYNNVSCLHNLPQVVNTSSGDIMGNPLTCVPNQTDYSLGLPLCMENDSVNNPNNCQSVANIVGYVYTDLNADCNYDPNDLNLDNIPVRLLDSQNNQVAISYTINGMYSFGSLQPDSFIVFIDDNALPFSLSCGQSNQQNVVLDSVYQTIVNINFALVCDSTYDIYVQSVNAHGWVSPGQIHTLQTNVNNSQAWFSSNCGSSLYSGQVNIQINGPVTYVSPAAYALTPQVNGNTFTYSINDFNNLTPLSFGLNLLTDTTAQSGDSICVHVSFTSIPADQDTINNVSDFCYQVLASFDPNMKEVYPIHVNPGYNDWFTYTIHFQNTGSAPAFNILLKDTLDALLDISTFEVRDFSHPATVSLNGNVLTVRFNNIMLPDSTSDLTGSMGYFQYRIKPLSNLPAGSQISNTAYIYFDYNSPIVTNTTQNNFNFITGVNATLLPTDFILFPNPSKGIYNFVDTKNVKNVEVFNVLGEQIISQANQKQINLSAYPSGIYFARINNITVIKLIKE
ncbi:MAG: T9SS type A sorting domain-containing protein [Bacteroidia bacterium]|nr:T9SS type A sorting domain-containing protein [Bacteroidia bacterium]MCZ2249760.1 T9SS type A sorting domain-containing protein [Bacteroidia bacterium]